MSKSTTRINNPNGGRPVFINAPGRPGTVVINEESGGLPDNNINAPVIYRLWTSTDGTKIRVSFNKAMMNPSGLQASFSVTGKTVTAVGLMSGTTNVIEITVSVAFVEGDVVLLQYTRGVVQATDEGYLQSFGPAIVLNGVSDSTMPFFENWDFFVDATDASTVVETSGNIIRLNDKAATGRIFRVAGTAYATYAAGLIAVENSSTNEYQATEEVRKPTGGTFCFFLKFKTPPAADPDATDAIYFLRHTSAGGVILSNYNATPQRRNMRVFTTLDYWLSTTVQNSIQNNDTLNYIVATYDGTTYKMWSNNDAFVARSMTISTVEIFNRIFSVISTARSPYSLQTMGLGPYISDANVSTLRTALSTYGS